MLPVIPYQPGGNVARRRRQNIYAALGGSGLATASYLIHKGKQAYDRFYSSKPSFRSAPKQTITVTTRRAKKKKTFPKKVRSQIKHLKKMVESDMGTHIQRFRDTDALLCSVNSSNFSSPFGVTTSNLEAVLANLKYYNPSVPGTLTTAAGATGTFQKEFMFDQLHSSVEITNNYQVPCKVTVYCMTPKDDTSISPATAFTSGLTDVGGVSSTSSLIYPTDSLILKDMWAINKSRTFRLMPGATRSLSYTSKKFQYDPSLVDTHTLSYQKKFGAHVWCFRVEGVLGHDTTADEQGSLQAGIDIQYNVKYVVKYSAGADITQIVVDDQSSTFTNGGVVSEKPVSDNLQYSVA